MLPVTSRSDITSLSSSYQKARSASTEPLVEMLILIASQVCITRLTISYAIRFDSSNYYSRCFIRRFIAGSRSANDSKTSSKPS